MKVIQPKNHPEIELKIERNNFQQIWTIKEYDSTKAMFTFVPLIYGADLSKTKLRFTENTILEYKCDLQDWTQGCSFIYS